MVKKSSLCIIISTLICTFSIGVGIAFAILGTYQVEYYEQNYKHVLMKVQGYSIKNETCSETLNAQLPFTGYVILEYNVNFNNTNKIYITNISDICGNTYYDTIEKEKESYPLGKLMSAWYFVDDPQIWVKYKPRGEMYMIGGLCIGIVFSLSLMISILYICRRIKKNQRIQQRSTFNFPF